MVMITPSEKRILDSPPNTTCNTTGETNQGVVNGPSRTLGLAKFPSNFTGVAVWLFKILYASDSLSFKTKLSWSHRLSRAYK